MKFAASIRYGGLLVTPFECDYNSYKHLGLVCPHCHESVFIVREAERSEHSRTLASGKTIEVKKAIIPAHFSHRENQEEKDQVCELKVNSLTQENLLQIQQKSHNQLIKKLHRHFWEILCASPKLQNTEANLALIHRFLKQHKARIQGQKMPLLKVYNLAIEGVCQLLKHPWHFEEFQLNQKAVFQQWFGNIEKAVNNSSTLLTPENKIYYQSLLEMNQTLDLNIHGKIVSEAYLFLLKPQQKKLLTKLVEEGFLSWLTAVLNQDKLLSTRSDAAFYQNFPLEIKPKQMEILQAIDIFFQTYFAFCASPDDPETKRQFTSIFGWIKDDLVQSLTFCDWAANFEKLDLRKGANT